MTLIENGVLPTGTIPTRDTAPGPPRSEGIVPLSGARSEAREGAEGRGSKPACAGLDGPEEQPPLGAAPSGAAAQGDGPDQSACLRRKAGISRSSMPPDESASTRAAACVRLVRQTLGTDMPP